MSRIALIVLKGVHGTAYASTRTAPEILGGAGIQPGAFACWTPFQVAKADLPPS